MTDRAGAPVSRWKVLASLALLVAVIAGIVAMSEALRYPHPTDAAVTAPGAQPEPASDPRTVVDCGDPLPREGQERETEAPSNISRRVTSSRLYDCPQQYDGARVHYRGEVVGAVLRRDGGAWVQLNDDIYSQASGPLPAHRDYRGGNAGVGVFISPEMAASISAVGGPTMRGDVLDVVGVFHRVDKASNEVAVIRSITATRTAGEPLQRPMLPARRAVAIGIGLLMLVVLVLERRAARMS